MSVASPSRSIAAPSDVTFATAGNKPASAGQTLDGAIRQQINLGANDPFEIVEKIARLYGPEWLIAQIAPLATDIVAGMARAALGADRRGCEVALRVDDAKSQAEIKIARAWIPGEGWKRAADVTADDLEKRAAWYESFASASLRRASWCREVAAMIRSEVCRTLGELKAPLPPLPDGDSVDALVLGAVA